MSSPRFTVFTAAFNRREMLGRVYDSLRAQTYLNFEWVIVDDGSSDGTGEAVRGWQPDSPFPIRYLFQQNRGKHSAHNRAVIEAEGELFAVIDDDDCLVPNALERLVFHWTAIPEQQRQRYSGVTCLCRDQHGRMVGRPFPADVLDCRHYELEGRFGAVGEKWGFHRTAVLREFPFPQISGEKFCPESIVWNRIGRKYLIRHVNEALKVYYIHANSVTAQVRTVLMRNARASRLYYQEFLGLDLPLRFKCKQGINYVRYSLHAGVRAIETISDSAHPLFTAALALPGGILYAADLVRYSRPTRFAQGSDA